MKNATRSTTDTEAADSPAPTSTETAANHCPCQELVGTISREHHDWLLGFEARGIRGAIDLLNYMYFNEGCETEPGTLPWMEVQQFVSLHSWEEPAAVYQFVHLIDNEIRYRNRFSTARDALESVSAVVAAALEQTAR